MKSDTMNDRYQLVILGHEWDLYKIAYSDILQNKSVTYIGGYKPKSKFFRFLYKVHLSPKINQYVNLPFKRLWNKYFLSNIDKEAKTVFLIFQNWLSIDNTIHTIDFLRDTYKKGRIVLFLQDIVASFKNMYDNTPIDILLYKEKCDIVITYDKNDSRKYGLLYHPTVFSHKPLPIYEKFDYDVFFIGKYKGRLDLLLDIYKRLSSYGLNCKFIVLNVPKEKQQMPEKIEYINHIIGYLEVLQYINRSKCILEILQPGAVGYTYRLWEAISYNKYLISNNQSLRGSDFYESKYISIFNTVNDIDVSFMKETETPYDNINPYSKDISPYNLVDFIDKRLNVRILF